MADLFKAGDKDYIRKLNEMDANYNDAIVAVGDAHDNATLAGQYKDAAMAAAQAASLSETNSASSATLAGQHRDAAALSASSASASERAASQHKTDAQTAQAAAEAAQAGAEAAEANAVAVVTGGTATLTAEAGKIPIADANGHIDHAWMNKDELGIQYKPSVSPTLSSDFTKNDHKRYEQYGLEPKTILQQWDVVRNSTATYFDANGVLRTAGVNEPRIDYDPATGKCRGLLVEPQATRLNTIAAAPVAPENVTVTAVSHAVSFYGNGSVVLSGVATGTINGTGEKDRVYLSVTPTAGTLTLTPSGTVTNLQLETGTIPTSVILGEGTAVTRIADTITPTV